MKLRELFVQKIDRPIETVIKADDQEHIFQEMEEYVVTKEISRKIADFFEAYNDYYGANGVWISGFFGSGKSHLLKIISYVLENKEYNGYRLGERFAQKITDDEMLRGDVMSATRIPSESILFNIDQQAQITSKREEDAILNVFYKVFYDHLGYYGSQRHVAEFERWLDMENVFRAFRENFESETGEPWLTARHKYFHPKVKAAVAEVLGKLFSQSAEEYSGIIDTLRKDIVTSVDDFVTKVAGYIKTKTASFRLNFFVDEVGQYISDNSKLMLNLQTIAETLATRTKGSSWILVTSQEDMESVIGDMNQRQQNDFSRIQARFKLKIPLTSANVDEVIEKRLLSKKPEALDSLQLVWIKEQANLETLLSFTELGIQFRGYRDENDFANKYPFVAYQFDLFQQCIRALSDHNAFQGRHASVGERSMLGVFQDVMKNLGDKEQGQLVSFDLLFDGLRSTIRGEIQNAVTLAEKNLDNEFAVQVLKALFMVKYYQPFKTNARNISVLMIENMDVNLQKHEKAVKEALAKLEQQVYINRNGEIFEFLTDEEKDIEKEIINTPIDSQAVTQLIKESIFDRIIKDNRIKYAENKAEYDFTSKVDGLIFGKEKELTIEILSPNSEDYGQEDKYKARTLGYNTLVLFVLPPNDRLLQDLRLYLKTEKYIKQSKTTGNQNYKRILFDKGQQNVTRGKNIELQLRQLLGESTVYLNGSKHLAGTASDGRNKVFNVFQDLVKLAYPNLKMIGSIYFTENTIRDASRGSDSELWTGTEANLSQAENEIVNLVSRRKKQMERTSIADLLQHFQRKPYGWYPNAILTITAMVFKRSKIEAREDSNILSEKEFEQALFNNRRYSNVLLTPIEGVNPIKVKHLKEIYQEAFDESCPANDARDVALAFKKKIIHMQGEVDVLLNYKENYPFLHVLEPLNEMLKKLSQREHRYFLENIDNFEDELLDGKEDTLTPIKRFWNGGQKKIFDQIRTFVTGNQSNLEYVQGEELKILQEVYEHPKPYTG
ncbi:MAG: BREX system P-loop protein BrxC, partial [Bacteroidota bacterium]